ncbi:MAG TPA: NAD-glutamate dehydrogenase domain-containing protein [Vicinamibacteria bacterium]|nr:NAD-glutamate dehydrogenase domain-containing protein [Vicinamibacteria bacterium]
MITTDPKARAERLQALLDVLRGESPAEDRELVLQLAPPFFADMPDRIALGVPVPALAARLLAHFRFVVREMPPAHQLYRGLPGIHVSTRNPGEDEARRIGGGQGLPVETTIVETHTIDAPFIFESVKNYFRKQGLRVFSAIHPIFTVRRQWERIAWLGGPRDDGQKECYCHFQIEEVESRERLRRIEHEIYSVLKCVFTAVEDFQDMIRNVREMKPLLRGRNGDPAEVESSRSFLDWLLDDNYVFQGTVKYRIGADGQPERIPETATGVFQDPALLPVVFPGLVEEVESHLVPGPEDRRIIDIDYCNNASAIYHLEPIDDVVVREWGPDGTLQGAMLLMGRLAKGAFTQKAAAIPLLREKHDWILAQSGAMPKSHAYREIRALFNRFPQRELLYADASSLKDLVERLAHMTSDEEVVVHSRRGPGYVALSIAFSRLRYSYRIEEDLKLALADAFGPISFSTSADLGTVSLLLFYFEASRLEHAVEVEKARTLCTPLLTTWEDRAGTALELAFGEGEGRRLFRKYIRTESRSGLYRESTPPEQVPADIRLFEALEGRLEVRIAAKKPQIATINLYHVEPLGLTDTLRTLQNLGLEVVEELRLPLTLPETRTAYLYRFDVLAAAERIEALVAGEERFARALQALDEGRATDDPLNGLLLFAGLSWREVEVLRTLRNHLLQIRTHYNAETVNGVLLRNASVAAALHRYFRARFDPDFTGERAPAVEEAEAGVAKALESVRSLAEDEVLRALANLIRAALRTNVYQRPERPVFSIKVESRKVEGMPSPRPLFEIYVHSRRLEGIHLRGGKVARGGIRWSDRHDDFRTEILGLMKTQMVKNSVIVPVGSKGGFVLKGNVPGRPALDQYLVDRYREFVSGLLDVTDNVVEGKVLHPPEVVRHDGEDPYLVVAADKGTAHLSDTANSVSNQYGFWLGDAFASGGSAGYDHKKMGITARGAWECVKHSFWNLGMDIQKEPFTAIGIGDMSGDVFGNGALLSPVMKLVAAFNHAHVFLDPTPDIERSFKERQRLFALPRSGWRDYDPSLISKGGGVFDRSAKAIPLSPEMRSLLDIQGDAASGEEVIRRILQARVDLFYNGGIGTYVKAQGEDDADVGDRANDRVRVNGAEVRARVVGEGGNLGLTQRGRLEYWQKGGLINTDAVDNSGGVDTSDHEVNIKILMDVLVKKGVVKGREERNRILAEMTGEVAELVLADNAGQALCLSLDGIRSASRYEEFVQFVEDMLGAGVLNRADDAIPTRDELLASPGRKRGLPRPLLAVLLGHTKNWAFQMLMETDFPDSAAGRPLLAAYFPKRLRASYAEHFDGHALKREIIATVAVNYLVNNAGVTFLERVTEKTGTDLGTLVAAYLELDSQTAREKRAAVRAADSPAAKAQEALLDIEGALEAAILKKLA